MPSSECRRISRRAGLLVLPLTVAALLAGCLAPEAGSPGASARTALVLGGHANSQPLSGQDPVLVDLAASLVSGRAEVAVVPVDGAPVVTQRLRLVDNTNNDVQREAQDAQYTDGLLTLLTETRPATVEADYLAAIDLACRSAADGPAGSSVVVLGSGLSTVTLRLQDHLLDGGGTAADIVDRLEAAGSIPDLAGCPPIRWYGLGQTAAPQQRLTVAADQQLRELVTAVVDRAGAQVSFEPTPLLAGDPQDGLPHVSTVPVTGIVPVVQQTLPDTSVGFEVGTAELRDPGTATAAVAESASAIIDSGVDDVWVIGTTSSEGSDNVALGQERADLVREMLIGSGVPVEVLHAVGVGTDFAGFVPDRLPDGSLDEERARANRLVLLSSEPPR